MFDPLGVILTPPLKATKSVIHQEQSLYLIGFSFPFGPDPCTLFYLGHVTTFPLSSFFCSNCLGVSGINGEWNNRSAYPVSLSIFLIKPSSPVQFPSCPTAAPWLTPHPYPHHMSTTRLTEKEGSSVVNLLPVFHPTPGVGLASVFQIHSPFSLSSQELLLIFISSTQSYRKPRREKMS